MRRKYFAVLAIAVSLTGCQDANKIALKVGAPPSDAEKLRMVETRQFENIKPAALLASATATLQDLGYIISESAPAAGVLAAAKNRDAEETGQVAGQIALTIAFAALGAAYTPTWDKGQTIHVTLVVSPVDNSTAQQVRISFDRYVTNNYGEMWRTELITDTKTYEEFYNRLNKGLEVEKHL